MSYLFKSPGTLTWCRRDWTQPVGSLDVLNAEARRGQVRQGWFSWTRVHIPELLIERQAALLLLQGEHLTSLLIPNHELVDPQGRTYQLAHLILRVDPWEPWRAPSRLTNLVLAQLEQAPAGTPPTELLAALAADSAPA